LKTRLTAGAIAGLLIAAGVLASACSGDNRDDGDSPTPVGTQVPPVVLAAQADLARLHGVPVTQVQIRIVEEREWPDSCLGLARPGEVCAQVITPGYRVVFAHDNLTYEYRTDRRASFRPVP
jgi:hypothetical protein